MSDMCACGHTQHNHGQNGSCDKFLCCDRTRDRRIGHSGAEHDFTNHQTQHCPCVKFQAQPDRWQDDIEAGAIG